jgi:Flp pilus assembly protein TadD
MRPRPKGDPAHFYLWGLILSIKGKNYEAIRRVNRAVRLAPDYGLFRFKLAELKITEGAKDPKLAEELKIALDRMDDPEGKMAEYAGTLLHNSGYAKSAKYFFARANRKAAKK